MSNNYYYDSNSYQLLPSSTSDDTQSKSPPTSISLSTSPTTSVSAFNISIDSISSNFLSSSHIISSKFLPNQLKKLKKQYEKIKQNKSTSKIVSTYPISSVFNFFNSAFSLASSSSNSSIIMPSSFSTISLLFLLNYFNKKLIIKKMIINLIKLKLKKQKHFILLKKYEIFLNFKKKKYFFYTLLNKINYKKNYFIKEIFSHWYFKNKMYKKFLLKLKIFINIKRKKYLKYQEMINQFRGGSSTIHSYFNENFANNPFDHGNREQESDNTNKNGIREDENNLDQYLLNYSQNLGFKSSKPKPSLNYPQINSSTSFSLIKNEYRKINSYEKDENRIKEMKLNYLDKRIEKIKNSSPKTLKIEPKVDNFNQLMPLLSHINPILSNSNSSPLPLSSPIPLETPITYTSAPIPSSLATASPLSIGSSYSSTSSHIIETIKEIEKKNNQEEVSSSTTNVDLSLPLESPIPYDPRHDLLLEKIFLTISDPFNKNPSSIHTQFPSSTNNITESISLNQSNYETPHHTLSSHPHPLPQSFIPNLQSVPPSYIPHEYSSVPPSPYNLIDTYYSPTFPHSIPQYPFNTYPNLPIPPHINPLSVPPSVPPSVPHIVPPYVSPSGPHITPLGPPIVPHTTSSSNTPTNPPDTSNPPTYLSPPIPFPTDL